MIKEAIDRVLQLAAPNQITASQLLYVDKQMHIVKPPTADPVPISTLKGLVDLFAAQLDDIEKGDVLAHITSSTTVELISRASDQYGRRRCWVRATYPQNVKTFPFGQWLNPESFIINCQAGFQRVKIEEPDGAFAADLDYILKLASSITAETADVSEDDGISQKVTARRGIQLKEQTVLKPLVRLAPYRTFSEIDQQLSTFVFRARIGEGSVNLALFEADGGSWHLSAAAAIAAWLKEKLGATPIIS